MAGIAYSIFRVGLSGIDISQRYILGISVLLSIA